MMYKLLMGSKPTARYRRKIPSDLNFIKISFASLLILLLLAVPLIVNMFVNPLVSLDRRSDAAEQTGPIQAWVVSPNGGEYVYGNTEIQFFAKNALDANSKFSFTADLLKGGQFVKNLFSVGLDQQITDRNGIRSKYVDFTGFAEASDYKVKLTSTDATGKNTLVDYSDGFFTISPNKGFPVFTSKPAGLSIKVGQSFSYTITVADATNTTTKIVASSLPAWLKLDKNTLSGTPTVDGVYAVSLVAVNSLGRQATQVFSISASKNIATTAVPTTSPIPTDKSGGQLGTDPAASIIVKLPSGDRLSKEDSKIETVLPAELSNKLSKVTVEMSRDGAKWDKVYEGSSLSFSLDTAKYEGGDYYLRFTYDYTDGTRDVKSYGPVHMVKQNADPVSLDVSIRDLKPQDGESIIERTPTISATFVKPAGANVDLKSFKLEIDGKDVTSDPNTKLNVFSFSYTPSEPLSLEKHTIKIVIGAENSNPVSKVWSFTVVDKLNATDVTKDESLVKRNRILIAIIIAIIILIFFLALWGIALSKREQEYFLSNEEKKIIEQPVIR
jgi:Putative Ig domain